MGYVLLESGSRTLLESGSAALLLEGSGWTGTDVISAVQAWWRGTPAVAALVADGRLWHAVAAEPVPESYATVFLVSEVSQAWTTAYPRKLSEVQINLHAPTDTQARAAALAVRAALYNAPLTINGVRVGHVLPDSSGLTIGEELGAGGRDCWIATETFEVAWCTQ